jgi:prohibitin 2
MVLQVNVGLRVLTRPNPEKLSEIYRTLGVDYSERVLPSIIQACHAGLSQLHGEQAAPVAALSLVPALPGFISSQETLKSVIAQYNASQLLTQREVVSRDIRRILTERARFFNIVLEVRAVRACHVSITTDVACLCRHTAAVTRTQ